jgi:hypothetical protein
MSGWGDLGAALAGNGGSSDLAGIRGYQLGLETARRRLSIDEALYEERKRRDEEIGRQNLVESARRAGDDDLANFFLQSTNPASIGNYRIDRQKLQHGDAAWSAATAPNADMNAVNRMLAVMSGKPVDLTKIEGNTVLNPTVTQDQQHLQTNDIGQAMIAATNALAAQRNAGARANDALAGKREAGDGGIDDETMQSLMAQASTMANIGGPGANQDAADAWLRDQVALHGGFGKTGKTGGGGDLTKTEIDALFGSPDGGLNQNDYRAFLRYQHQQAQRDPRFASSRFAARAWVTNNMGGATGGSDTTAPVPGAAVAPGLGSRLMDALTGAVSGGAPSGPVDPGSQTTASDAVRPRSQQEFDALAPGTLFVNPADGRLMRKK